MGEKWKVGEIYKMFPSDRKNGSMTFVRVLRRILRALCIFKALFLIQKKKNLKRGKYDYFER